MSLNERMDEVRALARPFFEEDGAERVFVAMCCGRILVSVNEPTHCKTCEKPVIHTVLTIDDVCT